MDPIYLVANYSLFPFKRFCLYIFPEGKKGGRKEVEREITKNENRSKRRENDVNKGAGFRKEEMDESHRETLLSCPSFCSFSRSPGCCQTLPSLPGLIYSLPSPVHVEVFNSFSQHHPNTPARIRNQRKNLSPSLVLHQEGN